MRNASLYSFDLIFRGFLIMKRFALIGCLMVVILLAGCTEEKDTAKETAGSLEENMLTSKIHNLEEQLNNLTEQLEYLGKGKGLFTTYSGLSFDFMKHCKREIWFF